MHERSHKNDPSGSCCHTSSRSRPSAAARARTTRAAPSVPTPPARRAPRRRTARESADDPAAEAKRPQVSVLTGNRGLDTLKGIFWLARYDCRCARSATLRVWHGAMCVGRTSGRSTREYISAVEVFDLTRHDGRLSLVIDADRGLGARRRGAIRREFSRQLLLETFDADWRDVVHPP